ncbi:LacI family DNA-binding transcriptional regulator [Aquincola sp. S2]|uniref:LacI family DNA-binding transcriptional regulator n=1 Tax=Pseudaquabacterium terrae TaxID=2732868 RepID=A0ABX2EMB1_9BURK|nr:LacI family DNA-binding transcriptional regulator [Aquabacterium terrae]NRF69786.1 LacI family DNA-binding transcriptional regulator [Aquabacterium terrae]
MSSRTAPPNDPADDARPARVTLKQVAEAAGVSLATASYSLNNGGSVGQETRDRVIAVAEQLGYRPNLAAKAMRTGRTGTLGFVLPDLTNPFFPLLAQTVIHAARGEGYGVFLTDSQGSKEAEAQSIDALVRRGVDGVIWFPIDDLPDRQPNLNGVPTVVLDRSLGGFDCVLADFAAGGRLAAECLLAAGHRRIGLITGPLAASSARERADGARETILARGELAWEVEAAFSADLESSVVGLLNQRSATAVIAGADLIAIGVIRALRSAGLRVPQDVSVIGFDNIPWTDLCAPPLTTIELPVPEMGVEAVQQLLRRLRTPEEPRRRIVFDVGLVERASVAAPSTDADKPPAKARRRWFRAGQG